MFKFFGFYRRFRSGFLGSLGEFSVSVSVGVFRVFRWVETILGAGFCFS